MTFPNRLRTLRKEAGMTQLKLGKMVGVGAPTICAYEKNQRAPSAFALCCLADALSVSMDYLYGRTDKE